MTLQTNLPYVAMAALALILSDVPAARALWFCDIYPERCQYTYTGKGYYYPQGYRLPSETPGFGAGNAAGPHWGCGATDGKTASGYSANYPSRSAAEGGALTGCRGRSTAGTCRIISCNASVRSLDQAHAIWPTHPRQ